MNDDFINVLRSLGMVLHESFYKVIYEEYCLNKRALLVLRVISEPEYQPVSQIEIGNKLGFDRSSMVILLDDLESKEYIKRSKNPKNRRENLVHPTKSGIETYKKILSSLENQVELLGNELSDNELEQFIATAKKIIKFGEKSNESRTTKICSTK